LQTFERVIPGGYPVILSSMSAIVFKLRNVPEDEARDVRELLTTHNIEFFETTAGNWGISMPGLWVEDDDVQRSRELINDYQIQRAAEHRQRRQEAIARGEHAAWYQPFVTRPVATLGTVLFCLFIIYALLAPFIRLATAQ